MNEIKRNYIPWVDLLRVVACVMVVVSHCCDPFVGQLDNNPSDFLTGVLFGSGVRACVPLFVMMSGILLLPIEMDVSTFYKKRTKRLLLPFVFWSIILPILYFLYINSGIHILNPNIDFDSYTLPKTFEKIYTFIFNFNYDTTVLWYVYMLIGLYLFMPILSAWLKQASQKDIKIFLKVWCVTLLLPYIQFVAPFLSYTGNGDNMGLLGVCDWNMFGTFYYFSGFIGYLVLAYYFTKYPLNWSMSKTLSIALPTFALGYLITAVGFLIMHKYYPGNFPNYEIVWNFNNINVMLMTISIFIIAQKIQMKPSPLLKTLAALTFGVFLFHFIVVQASYDLIYASVNIPAALKIVLMVVFSFVVSTLVVWLMSLNKWTRKFVM